MGLFTKACTRDEVLQFIDALQRGDDAVADPLGERIFKTKNASSIAVLDALLLVAGILAGGGLTIDPESADTYLSASTGDRPAVIQAKRELVVAFFGSLDPVTAVDETTRRHAADPALKNVDRMDNLLSLLWSAAEINRDSGVSMRFGPGADADRAAASSRPAVPEAAPPSSAVAIDAHPADWYPDPHGVARLRYWDGATWTEHTA